MIIYVEIHLPGTCISYLENEGVDQMLPKGVSNTCAVWFMYFGHCISVSIYYKLKRMKKDNISLQFPNHLTVDQDIGCLKDYVTLN